MNTNWHELKEKIYFEDGSLRDVYVFDINLEDWKNWVDFVNQNYEVEFECGETQVKISSIDFSIVKNTWFDQTKSRNRLTIKIGRFNINCHFFSSEEFENDILPKEFKSLEDHELLMDYFSELSRIFNKKVFLTLESSPEVILLEVFNSKISVKL